MIILSILAALFHVAIVAAYALQKINKVAFLIGFGCVVALQLAGLVVRSVIGGAPWWLVLLPAYAPVAVGIVTLIGVLLYLVFVYKIKINL